MKEEYDYISYRFIKKCCIFLLLTHLRDVAPQTVSVEVELNIKDEYIFPDTYRKSEIYLNITWSTKKTCDSDPRCLEVILRRGDYIDMSVAVTFVKDSDGLTECRLDEASFPTGGKPSIRTPDVLKNKSETSTGEHQCGLGFQTVADTSTGRLGYIYAAEDNCPNKDIFHACTMRISVTYSGVVKAENISKIRLFDRDEKPICPSDYVISWACGLSYIKCDDRDTYLMENCGALGCLSHTKNTYRVIPEHVLNVTSSGDRLTLQVLEIFNSFTASIEVHSLYGHYTPFNISILYRPDLSYDRIDQATGLIFRFDTKIERNASSEGVVSTYLKDKIKELFMAKMQDVSLLDLQIIFSDANRTENTSHHWEYALSIHGLSCRNDNLAEMVKTAMPSTCFLPLFQPVGAKVLNETKDMDPNLMFNDTVQMCCRFQVVVGSHRPHVMWQFQNDLLKTSSLWNTNQTVTKVDDQVDPLLNVTEVQIKGCLEIPFLKPEMAGEYRCSLMAENQTKVLASDIRRIPTVNVLPRVIQWPVETWAEAGGVVNIVCKFHHSDYYEFQINELGGENQTIKMEKTNDSLFTLNETIEVHEHRIIILCTGLNLACGARCNTTAKISIHPVQSENETVPCEQTTDRRGVVWASTPGGNTVLSSCPEGYAGQVSKTCSQRGHWQSSNYSKCENVELLNVKELLKFTENNLEPSTETVTELANKLSSAVNQTKTIHSNDISQTVNLLGKLKVFVKRNASQVGNTSASTPVISNTAVKSVAKVAAQILSASTSEWQEAAGIDNTTDDDGTQTDKATTNPASNLCLTVDSLVSSSLNDPQMESGTIIEENIVISRHTVEKNEDVVSPTDSEKKSLGDVYQTTAYLNAKSLPENQDIRYSAVRYKEIEDKLPSQLLEKGSRCKPRLGSRQDKSEVFALSLNVPVETLSPRLNLTFQVSENSSGHMCGFLKPSDGTWSTDGCETEFVEEEMTVVCYCDHLTNFMVLMDHAGVNIDSAHHVVLSIMTVIGFTISIICLALTILAYLLFWRYVRADRSILHVNLSVCLILFYIIFWAGIDVCNENGCTAVAIVLHYVLLAVLFLMFCEALEVFIAVSVVFTRGSQKWWKYLIIAYGSPAIIVAVSLAATEVKNYRSDQICWLNHETGAIWAFLTFVIVIVTVNIVLCAIIMRTMAGTATMRNKETLVRAKTIVRAVLLLSPVMGITWIFGMFPFSTTKTYLFEYLFIMCNSLQGVFVFIFYCALSQQVQDGFRHFYRKVRTRRSGASGTSYNLAARTTAQKSDKTVTLD